MFSGWLSVLGEEDGAEDASVTVPPPAAVAAEDVQSRAATAPAADASSSARSLWQLAASVGSSVSGAVKQSSEEFLRSVADTDWRAELEAFGREVQHDTATALAHAGHGFDMEPEEQHQQQEHQRQHHQHNMGGGNDTRISAAHFAAFAEVRSSLASLGNSLLQNTKNIVGQVKHVVESEISTIAKELQDIRPEEKRGQTSKYNRLEEEVSAMQRNSSTYCDAPEDGEHFARWLSGFDLTSRAGDIEALLRDNAFMAELGRRIVPALVSYEDFWTRYFYRLHKLHQRDVQRQQLARLATSQGGTEEVAWEEEEEEEKEQGAGSLQRADGGQPAAAAANATPHPQNAAATASHSSGAADDRRGAATGDGVCGGGGDAAAAATGAGAAPHDVGASGSQGPVGEPADLTQPPAVVHAPEPGAAERVGSSCADADGEGDLSAETASNESGNRDWLVVVDHGAQRGDPAHAKGSKPAEGHPSQCLSPVKELEAAGNRGDGKAQARAREPDAHEELEARKQTVKNEVDTYKEEEEFDDREGDVLKTDDPPDTGAAERMAQTHKDEEEDWEDWD